MDTWMTPYQPLPGTQLGPHDWLEFGGDADLIARDPDLRLLDGITWWHHADSPPAGARPKGGRCGGGNLHLHDLADGTADDLTGITITPSLLCRMCGRHIFITAGRVRDLGNAHEGEHA
jgi:hypothetical protein